MEKFDVIVIGQGYAGLTAAKVALERGLRVLNIERNCMGGLILNINELDPAPEGSEHSGSELASNLAMSNMDAGIEMPTESVTSLQRIDSSWQVDTDSGAQYLARHIIVASGASLRKLEIPGESDFFGQGVSECADCDGPMFRGMQTVVVGGGDSAFQEATALSQYAEKVTIVMRGSAPRARRQLVERVTSDPKIVQIFGTEVTSIQGTPGQGVEGVLLRSSNDAETTMAVGGVFVFIGLKPNTDFLPDNVERDSAGALKAAADCSTSEPGLWVIGAARSGFGGLLTHADKDVHCVFEALV